MDNKKWSKRFSTVFWWSLTILPFLIIIASIIGVVLNQVQLGQINSNIASQLTGAFYDATQNLGDFMGDYTPSFLTSTFDNVFGNFGISDSQWLSYCLSWMVTVQFIHLLFDVVSLIPKLCHEFMEAKC